MDQALQAARRFGFARDGVGAVRYGNGHIHETYLVSGLRQGTAARVVLQRMNGGVFRDPIRVMENIERVIRHLAWKAACAGLEARPPCPALIPTEEGRSYHQDSSGAIWRAYAFVDGARSIDTPDTPEQAYQAAAAFGRFQSALADLPPPRLHVTIPDFHHTRKRFEALMDAVHADPWNRAGGASAEIAFACSREPLVDILLDAAASGALPERVAHNDTKLNNVLLDMRTGEARCVVDLDTTMPGLGLYDFGDLVRTAGCRAAEDERDLASVELDPRLFEAVARGWLDSTAAILTPAERSFLELAGRLTTFELGLRFLTDYVGGDVYFRTHRPGQNLDRCRKQFKLVQSMERQDEALRRILDRLAAR